MNEFAEDLIKRAEIGKLQCPNDKCNTHLTEINLKDINLDEEFIEKFTVFSINQAVDLMDDFGWCPITECGCPAEIDKMKNYGMCTQCRFTFCLTCKEKYHFFKQCPSLKVGFDKKFSEQFKNETT
jgi:hypothetical protein